MILGDEIMSKNIRRDEKFIVGVLLFLAVAFLFLVHPQETQAAGSLPIPERVMAKKESETSIRIKWKTCKNVDGYYIYRYNKKKGKYKKVKEVIGARKRTWVDKKVKTGKLYQYKVASFRKKKKSKKSYVVSAMAYGKDATVVNAGLVDFDISNSWEMGICANFKITAEIDGDFSVKYYDPTLISDELVWSSSDPTMASVDGEGNVTTYEKEGVCEIIARAHNGVIGKVKLTIINYARPKSFPYYDGSHPMVNLMLTEYKENVFRIATYFTVHKQKGVRGKLKLDEAGTVTGYPDFPNIESIYGDVENIVRNFPLVTEISYSSWGVNFEMKYDFYGRSWCRIDYVIESDESNYPGRIATHWSYTTFAAEPDFSDQE